jgi:hypothetical protein
MIFNSPEYLRLFVVFVPQIFLVGMFSFLIFKILKRNANRSSYMLSGFYFTVSLGFSMNGIAVLIAFYSPREIIMILYFLATYLIMFSFAFVIVFILTLLKLKYVFTLKKAFVIILAYAIAWLLLHLFPGGVTYSENWVPVYSFPLFLAANVLFTLSYTIPVIYYSIRLRKTFTDATLKKKLTLFLVGNTMLIFLVYGVLLYNTWQEPTFKTVWGLSAIILLFSSGLLIYYGIGRDL